MINPLQMEDNELYSPQSSEDCVDRFRRAFFPFNSTSNRSMSNTDLELIVDNGNTRITLPLGETYSIHQYSWLSHLEVAKEV